MLNKVSTILVLMSTVSIYTVISIAVIHTFALQAEAGSVTDGLVGYWPFDESSVLNGETVIDTSGDNDGTIKGGAEIAIGVAGDALKFDGEDDYVDLDNGGGTVNDVINGSSAVTVSAWVNPDEISAYCHTHPGVWFCDTETGLPGLPVRQQDRP